MSGDLYKRAASKNKNYHVVEGTNHISLYDVPRCVGEAVSKLAPFFKAKPGGSAVRGGGWRVMRNGVRNPP